MILFSLLYYRALGLVTIGSLAVSGLILYAVTTLLGHSAVGYTLSLPGIAGFIVAVGITADSFVVFFERLRDEMREGIRLRSAVERAWPRARRTIISADSVSLLAAVILYIVSIGDVRGFAFTLGLSTLSDLFIVFFFTKPLLTFLARRPAFDKGESWTGVGRPRDGARVRDDADPADRGAGPDVRGRPEMDVNSRSWPPGSTAGRSPRSSPSVDAGTPVPRQSWSSASSASSSSASTRRSTSRAARFQGPLNGHSTEQVVSAVESTGVTPELQQTTGTGRPSGSGSRPRHSRRSAARARLTRSRTRSTRSSASARTRRA